MEPREERILILTPTGRDATLAAALLDREQVPSECCMDASELCRAVKEGAGAVLLAEEALSPETVELLLEALGRQEPWSDLPLVVFTRDGGRSEDVLEFLGPLGNATLLERPVRLTTLVSAVQAALRARRRQYQVRDLLRSLEDSDRRKDEFLAMLGHEIRNPLAAIRNSLWVLGQVGAPDGQEARQREVMERQIHHLTRMVDDLLDVSRVTRGKIQLQKQRVNLLEVAERCLQELGMAAQAASRSLKLSLVAAPAFVKGDPVRLEQVVCNLVQNAIKYTPPGGELTITIGREDGQGTIRVRDTGIGISPEMLPRVFDLFTQVDSSIERSQGGLGLGLPLVRSLVELHGGGVSATSGGPRQGSEFVVRLPLDESLPAARRAPRAKEPKGNGQCLSELRLLVVEDNADGRESMRELLEIWGHQVELAEDGPQGVEKALSSRPDVALVDIGLPGFDGNEVARRIRNALDPRQLCLIAMTGYGQPEDRRCALQAGFDNYLVKPVDPARLSSLLEGVRQRLARTECPAAV